MSTPPRASQQAAYVVLFQQLHHYRRIPTLRFPHQQVQVLRHDHVPDHHEAVAPAYFFRNL
jgi:hypothetical protein